MCRTVIKDWQRYEISKLNRCISVLFANHVQFLFNIRISLLPTFCTKRCYFIKIRLTLTLRNTITRRILFRKIDIHL